jgi:hypothetical protein
MTTRLQALCFDANDPELLARFWGGVLRLEIADDPSGGKVLLPADELGFPLRFLPVPNEKWGHNQMHFDLTSSVGGFTTWVRSSTSLTWCSRIRRATSSV